MVKVHDGAGPEKKDPLAIGSDHVSKAYEDVQFLKERTKGLDAVHSSSEEQNRKAKERMAWAFATALFCAGVGGHLASGHSGKTENVSFGLAAFATLSSLGASFLAVSRKRKTQSKLDAVSDDLAIEEAAFLKAQGRHSMASQMYKDLIMNHPYK